MAVPDFQTVMLPLLVLMGDGSEHSLAEVIENLGNRLGLSPEEKKELLPSESEPRFDNRVVFKKSGTSCSSESTASLIQYDAAEVL